MEIPKFLVQDSLQTEQFQNKMLDMMKKLTAKCERIQVDIRNLKSQILN
jgi:hypothetical protein